MELKDYYFVDVHEIKEYTKNITLKFENEKEDIIYITKQIKSDDISIEFIKSAENCGTLDKFIEKYGFNEIKFYKNWDRTAKKDIKKGE